MTERKTYHSTLGDLLLEAENRTLTMCKWSDTTIHDNEGCVSSCSKGGFLDIVSSQLDEYLAGKRKTFDIPLADRGTPFDNIVWNLIASIPYGDTMSYSQIARMTGRPGGARTVANACRRNPLCIFVPCHRVIAADGSLSGYSGGRERKKRLLQLEKFPDQQQCYIRKNM